MGHGGDYGYGNGDICFMPQIDPELPDCEHCKGSGGFDASKNCEEYDEWVECVYCDGTGKAMFDEIFVPARDAWTAAD